MWRAGVTNRGRRRPPRLPAEHERDRPHDRTWTDYNAPRLHEPHRCRDRRRARRQRSPNRTRAPFQITGLSIANGRHVLDPLERHRHRPGRGRRPRPSTTSRSRLGAAVDDGTRASPRPSPADGAEDIPSTPTSRHVQRAGGRHRPVVRLECSATGAHTASPPADRRPSPSIRPRTSRRLETCTVTVDGRRRHRPGRQRPARHDGRPRSASTSRSARVRRRLHPDLRHPGQRRGRRHHRARSRPKASSSATSRAPPRQPASTSRTRPATATRRRPTASSSSPAARTSSPSATRPGDGLRARTIQPDDDQRLEQQHRAVPAANIVALRHRQRRRRPTSTCPSPTPSFPERYEGMRVRFPQPLVISEYFNYDRFGEIVLALPLDGEPRPFTRHGHRAARRGGERPSLANSLQPDHARRRPERPEPAGPAASERRRRSR